jgi:signal transduction histidine kinase/ActR/RegA family two-component response regulator
VSDQPAELRVAVLPPTRADGVAIGKVLTASDIPYTLVDSVAGLCSAIDEGVGMVVLGEEGLAEDQPSLAACVARQPLWSDLPILLLSRAGREPGILGESLAALGNVSVVERPIRTTTLVSLVQSNHRARMRQYEIREYLNRQHRSELERDQLLASERAARSEAERASRMKDEFLATLSHELRTPLNAVLGWTQVLRQFRAVPEEVGQGLTVIERNARSQAQIIEDLLDMSGIISGKVRLEVERVDVGAVVRSTVETIRPAAQAKHTRLDIAIDPLGGFVLGDPNRLQQIFWNLLTNAVKFTAAGGRIDVTLGIVEGQVEVVVADDGQGIDRGFLPHVFDKFRQADASSSRQHGGLGLGLSIVKQLVEMHGGVISAESAGSGKGSTFRVRLPVMAATEPLATADRRLDSSEPRARRAALAAPLGETLTGITVLVVDDEADSRSLIQRLLEDREARVLTASSAAEAIQQLSTRVPDALISDIGMPGEDGYSLIKRIRAMDGATAQVPAIALTAYARIEDRLRAIHAGYQLHLAKPVEPAELVTMLKSIVRRPTRTELTT